MKQKRARELGLVIGTGKKTPEQLQQRLRQRGTVIPDKTKAVDKRACRDRKHWDR